MITIHDSYHSFIAPDDFSDKDKEWYNLTSQSSSIVSDGNGRTENIGGYIDHRRPRIFIDNKVAHGSAIIEGGNDIPQIENPSLSEKYTTSGGETVSINTVGVVDYVALVGKNLAKSFMSTRIEIIDTEPLVPVTIMIQDFFDFETESPIVHQFSPINSPTIKITFSSAPGPLFTLCTVRAGQSLVIPRGINVGYSPLHLNKSTSMVAGRSESGNFLGKITRNAFSRGSIDIKNISPIFYRRFIKDFADKAVREPFFWAWKPERYPDETFYCWTTSDVSAQNDLNNGFMSFKASIESSSGFAGNV